MAIGTPYEHVKWFRGRGTANGSTSKMPRPALLHPASVAAGQPLVESTPHYSPPVRSLESTNQGAQLFERHQAENRYVKDYSRSAFFEPTADTNVILRRYATSYTIQEKRPFLAPW